ncbi:ATP-binding protein [Litorivivens sp.]|uniref:sensor histidine kinase n=1 Tax=Litorivivens sp. TaxID=2020868 RepID=UPI00356A7209
MVSAIPEQGPARPRGIARLYPRKVMHWVAIGICLVVLPLLIAVASATLFMRELALDSQTTVLEGTESIRLSRTLNDLLLGMERNARVYQVIGDTKLLTNYKDLQAQFDSVAAELLEGEENLESARQISQLRATAVELFSVFTNEPPNSSLAVNSLQRFNTMRDLTRSLVDRNSQAIEDRVKGIHAYARRGQSILLWEALMVVPVAAGLGLVIMYRVSKPMRDLDRSIRRLGAGDIDEPIKVGGPQDIQALGYRLEWLRQRLGELANQKRIFLQHISHELKTPLASIREGTNLLQGQVVGVLNEQQLEVVGILESSSVQLQRRIEDLLAFSISDEPRSEMMLDSMALKPLIQEVIYRHELPMRAKNLQLKMDVRNTRIAADSEKLDAIIDNLVSNAVKFSPDNGVIRISESVQNGRLQLDVIDAGPGIHPSEAEKIFQPFYQSSTPYSGHLKGTGLGLAIARLYARMHRGDLNVIECKAGAHMQLTLPLAIERENGVQPTCTRESA